MNLICISDLHLNPVSRDRNEAFVAFLERAMREKDQVLIAGDLFDLWFGWEQLTLEFQRPILQEMQRLSRSGLIIDYVEGNRDFGIKQLEGKIFRSVSSTSLNFVWQNRSVHVQHGDVINKKDIPYRIWRAASKNRLSFFLLDHMPSKFVLRSAQHIESDLRATNIKHKSVYPEKHCEQFYLNLFHSGADLVIVGHFHTEREVHLHYGKREVLFFNLPGWESGFRYLVIPAGDQKPYFRNWGKQNGNSSAA